MDFRPLAEAERTQLRNALLRTGNGDVALLMDPRDTGFAGTAEAVEEDTRTINAVKSVPCHY